MGEPGLTHEKAAAECDQRIPASPLAEKCVVGHSNNNLRMLVQRGVAQAATAPFTFYLTTSENVLNPRKPQKTVTSQVDLLAKGWVEIAPSVKARIVDGRIEAYIGLTDNQANGEIAYEFIRNVPSRPQSAPNNRASLRGLSQNLQYGTDLRICEERNNAQNGLIIQALNSEVESIRVTLTTPPPDKTPTSFVISRDMIRNPGVLQNHRRLDFTIPFEARQGIAVPVGDSTVLITGGHTTRAFTDDAPKTNKAALVDFKTNPPTVEEVNPMLYERWGLRATVLADGKVFICGGGPHKECETYNPATRTFTPSGALSEARSGHEQVLLPNGEVLIVGGYAKDPGRKGSLKSIEIFNPASNETSKVLELKHDRAGHGVVAVGDKVFVIGGNKASTEIEIFNTQSKSLEQRTFNLPTALKDFRTHTHGTDIYIFGGSDASTGVSTDKILKLDTVTGTVTELPFKLSVAREDSTLVASRNGEVVYVISGEIKNKGQPNDGSKTAAIERVNLRTGEVTRLQSEIGRDDARGVSFDNKHYIIGGVYGDNDSFCQGADVFTEE